MFSDCSTMQSVVRLLILEALEINGVKWVNFVYGGLRDLSRTISSVITVIILFMRKYVYKTEIILLYYCLKMYSTVQKFGVDFIYLFIFYVFLFYLNLLLCFLALKLLLHLCLKLNIIMFYLSSHKTESKYFTP